MIRRSMWVVVLVVAVVTAGFVTASRRTAGPPLDPRSTAPDGARAIVELLERFGGDVRIIEGAPSADVDTALLLDDRLSRDEAADVESWVEEGGLLVVADADSLLSPRVAGSAVGMLEDRCPAPALDDVRGLDVGVARSYAAGPLATACFPTGDGYFVVVKPTGRGAIVSLGGPDPLTNDLLDEADNAVLAVALLAPTPTTAVAVVQPGVPGAGEQGLVGLVGTPVRAALAQLLVAFLVLVAWRSRRLGPPVDGNEQVRIDGSELTRAVARLLQANRRPDRAAAVLRDRARRELSAPLGLPLDAPVDQVVAVLASHTGRPPDEVRRAVADAVTNDRDLVEVAAQLAHIREEVLHDRRIPIHH